MATNTQNANLPGYDSNGYKIVTVVHTNTRTANTQQANLPGRDSNGYKNIKVGSNT